MSITPALMRVIYGTVAVFARSPAAAKAAARTWISRSNRGVTIRAM